LLSALRDKLSLSGSPHRDDADRAVDLVSRAIAHTSELAHGLTPIPKRGRLADALRQLGQESEKLLGVYCNVDCLCTGTQPTLGETTATHLYRIAQEAITNAVKHGKATRIDIRCAIAEGLLELTVADNGTGLPAGATERGGLGLHIMSYRARAIGGDLSVVPRAERGTLVRCQAPLEACTKAEA
jgi:signal transduction histidine kinase